MGITIGIDPIIFRVGGFALSWYSLVVMLAAATGITVALKVGAERGFKKDEVLNLMSWVLIAALVGSRLFHVVDLWDYYVQNPSQIFMLWHGGLAIWGGVTGALVTVVVYAYLRKLPVWRLLDVMALALLSGQIIGRIACVINGDEAGKVTSLPWGFIYTNPDSPLPLESLRNVPTHPYAVYEMIWNGLTLLFLWRMRKRVKVEGQLFLYYAALYSMARFFLTYVRVQREYAFGLQQAQWIALLMMVVVLVTGLYLLRKTKPAEERPA
ncbi:MAG: prolipoprotein diacylglyceryl transferase [Dehalococcoidia bacterium]|nr:prolipoprotein diacylglyceryl transferase [Dehalococcoidia bacterium]